MPAFPSNHYKVLDGLVKAAVLFSAYYYSYLSPQQMRNVEEIIEKLRPHIRDISMRTYYRKRQECIGALSSILWGYTSKDSMEVLEQFVPIA